jgi:hypothetical protein
LGSQNVLLVKEPVLIVRPDDGPIGLKHVALNVYLRIIIYMLDENINAFYKALNFISLTMYGYYYYYYFLTLRPSESLALLNYGRPFFLTDCRLSP